jgi:hypothetical protein
MHGGVHFCIVAGEPRGKSEGTDDGKGCTSNQQKINGEHKTAQACLPSGSPDNRRKSGPTSPAKSLAVKKRAPRFASPWCFP